MIGRKVSRDSFTHFVELYGTVDWGLCLCLFVVIVNKTATLVVIMHPCDVKLYMWCFIVMICYGFSLMWENDWCIYHNGCDILLSLMCISYVDGECMIKGFFYKETCDWVRLWLWDMESRGWISVLSDYLDVVIQ